MPSGAPRSVRGGLGLGLLLLLVAVPGDGAAQESCIFVAPTRSLRGVGPVTYVGNPHMTCADGVEIWADSAIAYDNLGMQLMLGSVRYRDRTRELQADTARYFDGPGRLQATGNVFLSDESDGSEIRNGDLVYLRQTASREVETMTVTTGRDGLRPVALVPPAAPQDSTGAAADSAVAPQPEMPPTTDPTPPGEEREPYRVVADRLVVHGDSYFTASGDVEIEQDSLLAFADSAEYDQQSGDLFLEGSARVQSQETELAGRAITMSSPGNDESEIRATREGVLTAEGLRLTAPVIAVFLTRGELQRLVATPVRGEEVDSADAVIPVAVLDEAELTGDSLQIVAPDANVERVVAIGQARSVSTARDSLNTESLPEIARTDWLEGDTVTVTFRPAGATSVDEVAAVEDTTAPPPPLPPPAADSTRAQYEIETVVAAGAARALYRLASSDEEARAGVDAPALHYVVGRQITIEFVAGDVDAMRVVGQTRGVHLEPLTRARPADSLAADTAAVQVDTSSVVPDTSGVRPDTAHAGTPQGIGPMNDRDAPRREPAKEEAPWIRE